MPDPDRGRRIRVVGISGSGKSRLASEVATRTGLARLELDAVFWDAEWTRRDVDEARQIVREFIAAHPEGWVIDGNWLSRVEGLLDPGSPGSPDEIAWLDHPRRVVMRRVVTRTVRRALLRQELWHGNRERPSNWFSRDPERNIMLWSWTQHGPTRDRILQLRDAGWPVTRLRGQREVDAWLRTLSPAEGPGHT